MSASPYGKPPNRHFPGGELGIKTSGEWLWRQDMAFRERLVLYRKMEELRERPLVVFVTSTRPKAEGKIAGDVVASFIDQLMVIPAETKRIDLLVASNGGDPTVIFP